MKFKLNDRVIWIEFLFNKEDIKNNSLLKGTVIDLVNTSMNRFIVIEWDNGLTIHYSDFSLKIATNFSPFYGNNGRGVGHVEIDLSYQRDKILNELGI